MNYIDWYLSGNTMNRQRLQLLGVSCMTISLHFVRVASQDVQECLTNYIVKLSLLEYKMLGYPPSLIAASAIFLARFILFP
ncbi:Cyclin-A1-2, partial [Mucuna pruriens]